MSTGFYVYEDNKQGRVVGIRQVREGKQKAFVWAIPPHEFLSVAELQPPIQDEYHTVYPFRVFIDDVVTSCTIHELDTRIVD